MYIEFKQGEKHAAKNADVADTPEKFDDCGWVLENSEIVIDIDHLPKDSIKKMIDLFQIRTQVVWTDRGAHLYFKKPVNFGKRMDGVCRLGFPIEQLTKSNRPNGVTIKRNGVLRDIDNPDLRQVMPEIFIVNDSRHSFKDLTGFSDGDGRNDALFKHRKALKECKNWDKILYFINNYVFDEHLSDEEFNSIARDLDINQEVNDRYFVATKIINECKTIVYGGSIWWMKDGQYTTDESNGMLIRRIYASCEGQDSRYVDEVIKQIRYRSPLVEDGTVFPIRFKNGVLQEGKFIPLKNYTDFTPYYIDTDYKEDAEPVEEVDTYIDNLTSGDSNYRDLLMEVIGYVMITDPERIRSLGKFFLFRGDGMNGKGTLLQIMKRIYNDKNCTSLSIKQIVDERYKVTMIGKLANLGDDIEAEAINNDQLKILKNITTADTVSTRRLYSQSESATFTVKLYFTTNSDIKSFEKGYAYQRRVVWMPMFNKVSRPDPYFISKMTTKAALEYWISLIVAGYQRLYNNREWTHSQIVEDYNSMYHEQNNSMLQFAKDLDPDTQVIGQNIREIKSRFEEWNTYEAKWSSKLFTDALWDLYEIGTGITSVAGEKKRVFMKQSETQQKLSH